VKPTARLTRRMIAAAGLATAAILLPVVALASSASPSTPKASASVPRCYRDQLTAWMGVPGNGTAGSVFYPLEISNVSTHSCTLYGFPGVSALKAGGGQLGSAAGRLTGYSVGLITLAPYQTVHVDLQVNDVGVFAPSSCHPTTAVALRVFAPGDYGSIKFPFSFRACAKAGPVYLHVSPTFSNTGIPGYMND
jgi:Protein of unknown function (DUF4232)